MTSIESSPASLCVQALRTLSLDMVEKANSGHPGLPLGAAPMAYVLWQRHLRHSPKTPDWPDRDRFILSPGHGSALLYALLHVYGYDLSLEDLKAFRQWESLTPGHPEVGLTAGVEATTGPLGQGTANAVGMAIAERRLAAMFNRDGHEIVDHYTYALVSDGDLMEGISAEAASLAGHLDLGRLIYLYDSNDISLDGPTSLCFTEDVAKRYEAYGWDVQQVDEGDRDLEAIDSAIQAAKDATDRPSLIIVKTTIGFGSPEKAGTAACHGSPLGQEETARTKKALGADPDASFHVPHQALEHARDRGDRGDDAQSHWADRFEAYQKAHPELAALWHRAQNGELPDGWDADLPTGNPEKNTATRQDSSAVLQVLGERVPWLLGGDADLSCSTKSEMKGSGWFDGGSGEGRNIHYGVREHAMGAIANGIALHGGLRPFVSTFFCFSDYMRPSVRLAALCELPVIYVWTHDSISVGEDGPTHQPVEHLMSLRAMPGLAVVRPCDAAETSAAWSWALRQDKTPVALVLSRQGLPQIDRDTHAHESGANNGAYTLIEASTSTPQAILIATGSEVSLAVEARETLEKEGVGTRVVSMPCWEAFEAQPDAYRESVLPKAVTARVSIEAGSTLGWSRWVGDRGVALGIDRFGASAPGGVNREKFGFTAHRIVTAVREIMESENS